MTERKALKLALEWIKSAPHGDNCFLHDDGEYNRCFCGKDSLENFIDEALAQTEQEPDYKALWEQMCERCDWLDKKLAVYSEAQPKQPEHDAAIKTLEGLGYTYHGGERWKPPLGKPAAWLAQTEQEPVAKAFVSKRRTDEHQITDIELTLTEAGKRLNSGEHKLYTTPPQRKPLTEKEIRTQYCGEKSSYWEFHNGVRYAEAAHGIKE